MKLERRRDSELRCALCHGPILRHAGWTCDACGTQVHTRCADVASRCPTLGCEARVTAPVRRESRASELLGSLRSALVVVLVLAACVAAALFLDFLTGQTLASFVVVGSLLVGVIGLWRIRRDIYA